MNKSWTTNNVAATDDLLDRIVQQERQLQKKRKDLYREQLQKQMDAHKSNKQKLKEMSKQELYTMYEKLKVLNREIQAAEDFERSKRQQRFKLESHFKQANKALMQQERRSVEQHPNGKSILEQFNEHNLQARQERRQKLNLQTQMNSVQQQIKRQNQMRLNSEKRYEEQMHLHQMEEFLQRRQRQKHHKLEKHRQNMKVYQQVQQLQQTQNQQAVQLITNIENYHQAERREKEMKDQQEQQKRQNEETWRNGVQKQLDDRRMRDFQSLQEKKKEREVMDAIDTHPKHQKNTRYLRELEAQMVQQKNKRRKQHEQLYSRSNQLPTILSPALLGKLPASLQRQRQLNQIDKGMGFTRDELTAVPVAFSPRNDVVVSRQMREYHQLKQKLNSSRQQNSSQMRVKNYALMQSTTLPRNQPQIQTQQPIVQPPNPKEQVSPVSRQMRMYDFITGRSRLYNIG